jgi:hypothetical protein
MPMISQLGNRVYLNQQRTLYLQQIQQFRSPGALRGDVRGFAAADIGDLAIVAPATFVQAAITLEDAAIRAAEMARAQGQGNLADAQLQILKDAIAAMILEVVAEAGDVPAEGDPMYSDALDRIVAKASQQ